MSAMSLWSLPLHIQRKGDFFSDNSFQDDRRFFESAATDLLKEFDRGGKDDSFKSYRRLRDNQLAGTDRTAKFSEEEDKYKIVMDVEGFEDADLQVKILGPNSICIEGSQECKQGNALTKKCFRRRFSLPNLALVDDTSSSLSSDNILTVKIPKKITEIKNVEELKSVDNLSQHIENLQEEIDKSFSDLKISSIFGNSKLGLDSSADESSHSNRRINLPIVSKESFFNDTFFENDRDIFQKSIQDILDRKRSRIGSHTDVFSKVREVNQDAQAVSVTDEEHQHKIVLDVHGYSEGDLKVHAVSDNELSVEGCTKKTTKYTNCCNSFRRNFNLPSCVSIREATSAISSDGILTILVPKNKAIPPNFSIPVVTEGTSQIKTSSEHVSVSQVEKNEKIIPVHLNSTVTTDHKQEQLVEQVVHSKVFGEDQKQKTSFNVVNEKVEHFLPINLIDDNSSQVTEKKVLSETITSKSQQQQSESVNNREHYMPVTLDAQITTQNVNQQQSYTQNQTKTRARIIPISYKGSFFDDSIFEEARNNFGRETREALNSFKSTNQVATNQSNVLQRSPSTMSDDATNYKIVLDVFGYEEHELKVLVSDINEISIEGNSEKTIGGTKTKKSFSRSFQLPSHVDFERTSTAMSSEGILTITIPKKNQVILKTENVIPITSQLTKANEEKTTMVVDVTGVVKDLKIEKKFDFDSSSTTNVTSSVSQQICQKQEEINLPNRIEEFSDTASVASMRDFQREESLASNVSSQTIVPVSTVDMMSLPIVPKGNFFDDTFFNDSTSNFESALKNTMNRFNRDTSFVDELGFYKNLRDRRITDGGNQTSTITDDAQFTKIVLDVHGFDQDSLSIKFDGKNEITIEGNQEEKTENSICKKRFRRSFNLSSGIDVNNVSSALSTDGILSIKVPKLDVKQLQI